MSGSRLPEATDPPCASGGEGEVSKSRRVALLPLALGLGLGLLFTLPALAAVIHLCEFQIKIALEVLYSHHK